MITKLSIILLTLFLLGICGFVILLILMQRPSEESGMGATLGGGAVTSVFGGEAVNTLAKATKYCVVIFFSLSFLLSLLHMSLEKTIKSQHFLELKAVATETVKEDDLQTTSADETSNTKQTETKANEDQSDQK